MDTSYEPVSVAVAIQANRDVREYTRFISRVGSVVEALLVGETGEGAVLAYNSAISMLKPFDSGDFQSALRRVPASGKQARLIDAGIRAVELLADRPVSRSRVLLLIGQPMDRGSESKLDTLVEYAERENVSVYTLTLPELGQSFVSDTISLQGVSRDERGGYRAGIDIGRLASTVSRAAVAQSARDPFSVLCAATGGTQIRFQKQRELEDAISAVGEALRSAYVLSYYTPPAEVGYHAIKVEVDRPGARTYSRAGYWLGGR
jgi:VWFA-related protein